VCFQHRSRWSLGSSCGPCRRPVPSPWYALCLVGRTFGPARSPVGGYARRAVSVHAHHTSAGLSWFDFILYHLVGLIHVSILIITSVLATFLLDLTLPLGRLADGFIQSDVHTHEERRVTHTHGGRRAAREQSWVYEVHALCCSSRVPKATVY
jgi:hypothetical protein